MFSRLRQVIDRINYYGAPRADSVWGRAYTWTILVCVLLALPAVYVADSVVRRTETVRTKQGEFYSSVGGQKIEDATAAYVSTSNFRSSESIPNGKVIGRWTVIELKETSGFPLTTSIGTLPFRLDVDMFAEPDPRQQVPVSAETQMLIADALANAGENELADLVQNGRGMVVRSAAAWVGSSLIWLMILFIASCVLLLVVRAAVHLIRVRKAVRAFHFRIEGKCAHCGYDLAGLEFSARCPECGELAH